MSRDAPRQKLPDETPDLHGAFPRLSDEQIARLAAHGEQRPTEPGQILFQEGDKEYDFHVVLDGRVECEQERGPRSGPWRCTGPAASSAS